MSTPLEKRQAVEAALKTMRKKLIDFEVKKKLGKLNPKDEHNYKFCLAAVNMGEKLLKGGFY